MWGKVLVWVLLLPYYLKGLCDVGVLRSLAICHLQFLVFAVLSRHVPALNVFPCGVPRLQKQTIWGSEVPKKWKTIITSNFYDYILLYLTSIDYWIYSNSKQMFPLPSLFFTLFRNIWKPIDMPFKYKLKKNYRYLSIYTDEDSQPLYKKFCVFNYRLLLISLCLWHEGKESCGFSRNAAIISYPHRFNFVRKQSKI